MNRVALQPAVALHTRSYSNTSLIVELLTREHGRVAVVARSARGPKSRYKGKLQLFSPLIVSWSGRGELKTLGNLELRGMPYQLEGDALLCGFYLNELLTRLLHRDDPYPNVFDLYEKTLKELDHVQNLAKTLRYFEKHFLYRLGYALPLQYEAGSQEPISETTRYQYMPERGFLRCDDAHEGVSAFSGSALIALKNDDFEQPELLKEMKQLMRIALSHHLGDKPLKSRALLT